MTTFALFILALMIGAGAMTALWVLSVQRRDASVVDLWWAPGFSVAALSVWIAGGAPTGGAQLLVMALLALWSARMTSMFLSRRRAHPGEDPRYTDLRESWGAGFWWKSLFIVFLLQALLQWLIALAPLAALAAPPAAPGLLGWLGATVALGGLAIETRADWELDAHKRGPRRDAVCDHGLRALVRYPNYLGEILFWVGVWLIAAGAGAWWTILSPLLIAFLLIKVSGAPILDARLAERPGARRWLDATPAFIPGSLGRLLERLTPSAQ
jgi:steroid 5-alpha reductase family enzyme